MRFEFHKAKQKIYLPSVMFWAGVFIIFSGVSWWFDIKGFLLFYPLFFPLYLLLEGMTSSYVIDHQTLIIKHFFVTTEVRRDAIRKVEMTKSPQWKRLIFGGPQTNFIIAYNKFDDIGVRTDSPEIHSFLSDFIPGNI